MEVVMLSKLNSYSSFVLIFMVLLLVGCFVGGAVYADGGGGQMPDPPPLSPPDNGSDPGVGITFVDVIVTLLAFVL
jgi:hypothetical protein